VSALPHQEEEYSQRSRKFTRIPKMRDYRDRRPGRGDTCPLRPHRTTPPQQDRPVLAQDGDPWPRLLGLVGPHDSKASHLPKSLASEFVERRLRGGSQASSLQSSYYAAPPDRPWHLY